MWTKIKRIRTIKFEVFFFQTEQHKTEIKRRGIEESALNGTYTALAEHKFLCFTNWIDRFAEKVKIKSTHSHTYLKNREEKYNDLKLKQRK